MNRDSMSGPTPSVLLPPARTRDVPSLQDAPTGMGLLRPVRSGLYAPIEAPPPVPQAEPPAFDRPSADTFDAVADENAGTVEFELVTDEMTLEIPAAGKAGGDEDITFEVIADEVDLSSVELASGDVEPQTVDHGADLLPDSGTPDDAQPDEEPIGEPVAWYGDDTSSPWEAEAREEVAEIVDDVDAEPVGDELVFEAEAPAGDDDESVSPEPHQQQHATGEADPAIREAPPPVSPWDLGAGTLSQGGGERAARARAEWESLGQALSESLSGSSPQPDVPGPHGYELTDEKAAELDAGSASPFGGQVLSVGSTGATAAESPVAELARRLEAFADSLREQGVSALSRAQTGDDRFDALLASIAAGFLAGREE